MQTDSASQKFLPARRTGMTDAAYELRTGIVALCHSFGSLEVIIEELKAHLGLDGTIPEKINTKALKEEVIGIARFMMTGYFKALPDAEKAKVLADYDAKGYQMYKASNRNGDRTRLLAKAKSHGWSYQHYTQLVRQREQIRTTIFKTLKMADRTLAEVAPEFTVDSETIDTDEEDEVQAQSQDEEMLAKYGFVPHEEIIAPNIERHTVTAPVKAERPILSTEPVEQVKEPDGVPATEPVQ